MNYIQKVLDIREIRKKASFDDLMTTLKNAFTRAWNTNAQDAILATIDRLRTLGPGKLATKDIDMLMATLESRVGAAAMEGALNGPVLKITEPVWSLGLAAGMKGSGLDIVFGLADLDAIAVVESSNLFWVGNAWDSVTGSKFENILKEYFDAGLTRQQLAAKMAADFDGIRKAGASYWDFIADHTATKTREIGRVSGYEKAGVEEVIVRAQLDSRTSQICRELDGKTIAVRKLRNQVDRYLAATEAGDAEKAKAAWPFLSDADAEKVASGDYVSGIGSPPYHGRCRTITVAVFR